MKSPGAPSVLTRTQKTDIRRHLAGLSAHDLWLRFGFHMSQPALDHYVDQLDFTSDTGVGIHDGESNLAGFTHVAIEPAKRCAELGISVSPEYRRRGYAKAMVHHALQFAAEAGVDRVYVYFRTSNLPMMRLARKAGFTVTADGGEAIASIAVRALPAEESWGTEAARPFASCPA